MLSNVEVRARRAYRFSLLSISLSSVRADAHTHGRTYSIQCESKKSLPKVFWRFFRNGWEFFVQILHVCCTFLPTLQHKFLFNWLQLWLSYAILSATTPFASYVQNVYHRPKRTLAFSENFPNSWEFLVQILYIFYTFLSTLDYKFLFSYMYLQPWPSYAIFSATTQRAYRPMVDILSI